MHLTATPTPSSTSASLAANPAYVWTIAAAAALGGMLFGYDQVVLFRFRIKGLSLDTGIAENPTSL